MYSTQGCNRQETTCESKYGNQTNIKPQWYWRTWIKVVEISDHVRGIWEKYQPEKEASPTETMIHQFKAKSFSCTLFEAAKFKH